MSRYDFIIAGGGIAGLSLAYHLINSPLRDCTMLIIDREEKLHNDRTLSFWITQPSLFDHLVYRTWRQLRVAAEGFEQITAINPYRYATIRGVDFYQQVREALASNPKVDFLQGKITQIDDLPHEGCVWVGEECYRGDWVFDSCFDRATFRPDPARYHALEQHFHGWVIETAQPAFDPQIATFMDFRTEQKDEMRFFYVLPYSEHQALIELVMMSQARCRPTLETYLEDVMGIGGYRIISKEGGISPLTDFPFLRRIGAHHMAIGTQGGQVKPSSGYAFTRIQRDSAAIVESLLAKGHPFEVPSESAIYRLYDRLLLEVMQQHGGALRPIFAAMFKNNPLERIFHLLDETASLREMLLIMLSVPPRHFIEAIFHQK